MLLDHARSPNARVPARPPLFAAGQFTISIHLYRNSEGVWRGASGAQGGVDYPNGVRLAALLRDMGGYSRCMVARMHPQSHARETLSEFTETNAEIVKLPLNDWDRLERWARLETARQQRDLRARNEALSRI